MRLVKIVYASIASLIAILIVLKSFDYLTPQFTSGFLSDKETDFSFYRPFLIMHITGAPVAFICGLFQVNLSRSKFHKYIGITYLLSVLLLAAPSAFIMAFYAIGGILSSMCFLILSALWLYFTIKAYLEVRLGNIKKHKQFMIRSYILTQSAILIRILSFFNIHFEILDPTIAYMIIIWLSWLPCLLFYEFKLLTSNGKT